MKNTHQQGVGGFCGRALVFYEIELIVLRRTVVFEFDAGTAEFGFEPIAAEIAHGRIGKIDVDPCARLAPGACKHARTTMRH